MFKPIQLSKGVQQFAHGYTHFIRVSTPHVFSSTPEKMLAQQGMFKAGISPALILLIFCPTLSDLSFPFLKFSASPESQGEVQTISPSIQGSPLSLNRYPFRPLPCTEHSTCTRPRHSAFLSFTCPSPGHPFTQMAPELNSQDMPMCPSLALEPSLPRSIISFMPAQSLPLDSYLQEKKKNARSVCIPTVPEPKCSQRGEFHFPERPPLPWATPDTRWRQGSSPLSLRTFCLA